MEEPSVLTPIAHALVITRLFYLISYLDFSEDLTSELQKMSSMLIGILRYLPFLISAIVVPGLLCFYSLDLTKKNQEPGRSMVESTFHQINNALFALGQRSWISGIK